MKFTTETNSVYEVDLKNKKMRHLTGIKPAHERQGDWVSFKEITAICIGESVIFTYGDNVPLLPGSPEGAIPTTVTSRVISILH